MLWGGGALQGELPCEGGAVTASTVAIVHQAQAVTKTNTVVNEAYICKDTLLDATSGWSIHS